MACPTDDTEIWSPELPPPLSAYLSNAISSSLDALRANAKRQARERANLVDQRSEPFTGVALPHSDNVYKRPHAEISGTFPAPMVLICDKVGNDGAHFPRQR